MTSALRRATRLALPLIAASALGACDSCRGERPYTPFGVASVLPSSGSPPATPSSSGSATALTSAAAGLAVKKALFAGTAVRHWKFGALELEAPPGRIFEQGLASDFNADGEQEIVAWTLPDPENKEPASPGELWLYPTSGASKRLLEFPGFLPTGGNCTPLVALSQSAAATVVLEIRVACITQLVGRAATRALALIAPFADQQPRFGVRAADSAPGEVLTLDLNARDEDADGRDDFRLSAGLSRSNAAPEVSANFLFLDRAAGISRDAREPAKGLLELLKRDTSRALKKKTAESALAHVDAARRLLASICGEGATPRVFDWNGNPLPCGGLSDVIDRLGAIEVSAHLAEGDVAAALGALGRDGWYFTSFKPALRAQLSKDIEKQTKVVPVNRTSLGARPKSVKTPSFSPLRFESSGALLIMTDSGLYRLAPDAIREEALGGDTSGALAWPLDVVSQRGERWLGASYSCARSEIELLMTGGSSEPLATTLLAPRPGVCGGARFEDAFTPTPLAADPHLEALVAGAFVGTRGAGAPPGSARSPNAAFVAIPTTLGLFVQSSANDSHGELWKIDGFSLAGVSGCVADDSGTRAACVRSGRAELYTKSPPQP